MREFNLIHIPSKEYRNGVELIKIYECLCDLTRLRVLNVLAQGPLCVCHFQEILDEPQVKISKHLAYLRARGLVECEREGNWMVYSLPSDPSPELKRNFACLQDCALEDPGFRKDLVRLKKIAPADEVAAVCERGGRGCGCEPPKRRQAAAATKQN
jgi:ArsR family transcriptional regulator, arsenate/arsenite/antimonite-responsive transcriptional repressor